MICCFLGHRDSPDTIYNELKTAIEKLITIDSVTHFYIGNHGNFDKMALRCLVELSKKYPFIKYEVVLAYIPQETPTYSTVFPEGIETVPKKFAICFRNKWMVKHSEFIIAYITKTFGGAYQSFKYAKNQKKIIVNLSDTKTDM